MEFLEPNEQIKKLQDELESSKKELNILKEEYNKLKKSSNNKQEIIDNNLAHDILASISKTNNLTKTAKEFNCEPEEIFYSIPCWDDCNDRLYELEDYEFYNYKIYGRENFLGDCLQTLQYNDLEEFNKLMRTPGQEELDGIFVEYKSGELTLYQLADKYNLVIINLFRLLHEHKLIESEADLIGYDEFYKEYIGEYEFNKFNIKTNLGLIDMYYYYLNKPKID
jgi:hypothetical protein